MSTMFIVILNQGILMTHPYPHDDSWAYLSVLQTKFYVFITIYILRHSCKWITER